MNGTIIRNGWAFWFALLAATILNANLARAHCDGMDGPVVKAAQKALVEGNVNFVLIWVQPGDEGAIRTAFQKTLVVRKLSPEARELADLYFFETLVRIHRAGEGAPYTGLKPGGRDLGPVIPAADEAIAEGSVDALLELLPESGHTEAHELFEAVLAKKDFKVDDVGAGREYVAGYVTFMHAVERLHGGGECDACEHEQKGKHAVGDHGVPQGLPKGKIRIDGKTTVRELVGRYSQTRPVFEERGIDYCCGGGQSLADAVQKHDLELPALVAALEKALQTPPKTSKPIDKDWYAVPLQELVTHIVGVHHTYMKKELPRLRTLEQRVLRAHGAKHGDMLRQVHALFVALDTELSNHLIQEEKVVFPQIVAADTGAREKASKRVASAGSIRNPIGQLEQEHENAGQLLAKLREATDNYTLPPNACLTFKALYDELQQMEADLHQHIHLENNVLFPRVLDLER
jgi:iron-sulfur cluster repair di-iron protein